MPIFTGVTKQLGGTEKDKLKQQFFYGLVQKNVLVTGGKGQLGTALKYWTERLNLPFRFFFVDADELDVTDRDQVNAFVEEQNIRYIINCAAYTAVDKAESDTEKVYAINADAVDYIAQVARKAGARVLHISTDFVFDGQSTVPYVETDRPNPLSVYGKSKLKGEEALRSAGGEWIILRTSWLYSEYGHNFVKTMLRLMNERERLTVVDDQRGAPTYAVDLAEMILHILRYSEENEWKSGLYHFSNRGETTWFGFASEIARQAAIDRRELVPVTTAEYGAPAPRPPYSVLDVSKISSAFRVEIPRWQDGLARCIGRLRDND